MNKFKKKVVLLFSTLFIGTICPVSSTYANQFIPGDKVYAATILTCNPTSLSLSKTSDTLLVGDTDTLTVLLKTPGTTNGAIKNAVKWISSNTKVATVKNGTITAVSVGTANITATLGNKTAHCFVTVNASVIISSIADISATVNLNNSYTLPSTVVATMSDGTNKSVAVAWDKVADTSVVGTFTFKGTVSEYNDGATFTLIVEELPNPAISFKDINLEQAVRMAINKPTGDINKSDVENVKELFVMGNPMPGSGVQDISGIENLTNLQNLILDGNQIVDISVLKGLTSLNYLGLGSNQISDISALRGLINLQNLSLGNNHISDISVLDGLTNLQSLSLDSNQISDISALKGLTKLQSLSFGNNKISNISALRALTNLNGLFVSQNQISDISALTGLINLQTLNLSNNQISDTSGLKGLTNLQWLNLDNNQISDISGVAGLVNLQMLSSINNQIRDISTLKGLTNIQWITLDSNQISDISGLTGLTNLGYLSLTNNQISNTDAQLFRNALPKCIFYW